MSVSHIAGGVNDAIGHTPLIRLRRASEATGCEILAKAEFMNPGQSVKDRAALYIVRDAERRGLLRPGGRIVEGTAGNTGIGLAPGRLRPRLSGHHRHPTHPEPGEEGRHRALMGRATGRSRCRALFANPDNYVKLFWASGCGAERAASRPGRSGPTSSTISPTGRPTSTTTGPEIWAQTGGRRRRLRLRGWHRRHPGWRGAGPEGEKSSRRDRPGRPLRRRAL